MSQKLDLTPTFLICSVRNATDEEKRELKDIVSQIEARGYRVHYPPWHTDQDDPIGLRICSDNRKAILDSEVVHVKYNQDSQGSHFDIGMAFGAGKPVHLINSDGFRADDQEILKFIFKYANNVDYNGHSRIYEVMRAKRDELRNKEVVMYNWETGNPNFPTPEFLIEFGIAFMQKGLVEETGISKYIFLENADQVRPTKGKSFQNVLLELTKEYEEGR